MSLAEGYSVVANDMNTREELRLRAAAQNAELAKQGFKEDGTIATDGVSGQQQDVVSKQLSLLQQQLAAQQNVIDAKDSALHFANSVETGDFSVAQQFLDKNQRIRDLWKSQGVNRVDNINFDKDSSLLAAIGFTPDQYSTPEARSKISKLFFKAQDDKGNWSVRSSEDVIKQTNMRANLAASQWNNINSAFRDAKTAMTPQKDTTSTVGELGKFTNDYMNLYPNATPQEVEQAFAKYQDTKKNSKGMEPFSIQTAKHFGDLMVKETNGTITQQEKAELDAHRTELAGAGYKTNSAMKSDITSFETKYGVDLTTVDANSLPPKAQSEIDRIIRNLEDSPSGKEVTKLISKDIEGGVGAVMVNAVKLAKLASLEHVETSVARNMLESVKEYIPESWRNIDDKDLANSEFRKVFLSTAAAMLKLQSGLTVSDKERDNFEASMGTLSKTMKVNMAGVKVKFDEIRANFQAIRILNPELYNLKYSDADRQLNSITGVLDQYIQPTSGKTRQSSTSGSSTSGQYTPKDLKAPPPLLHVPAGTNSQNNTSTRPPLDSFRLR